MVPLPVPDVFVVRAKVCKANVAVTDFAAFMVTVHVAVPVHAPLQPVKLEPAAAVAVSVTEALLA
jgi:hypothetical protein